MKKILLALILFNVVLSAQVSDIPLLEKKKKAVGQSINLDGSSEYASVTPNLLLTGQYSLTETFADGDYTNGNVWTVSSGSYAVNNSVANPLSTNQYSLVCNTAGVISIPCNQAYGSWEFDLYKGADANSIIILFIADRIGAVDTSYGYIFQMSELEAVRLLLNNGSHPIKMASAPSYVATNGVWYHVRIQKNTNGATSTWIKGGTFTTETLVSVTGGSGTNPVTDNTYTSSNYFVLDLDAGDRIANIQCEYGEGSLDLNGYARIKHSDDRNFEGSNVTWAGHGNHSIARSTTDKHAGSYSLAMTSSAAGDATTNYTELPATSFNTIEAGKKYTKEIWARGTGILGSELITNGGFDTDTDWTKGTGWSISGGKATHATGVASNLATSNTVWDGSYLGKVIRIQYTISNRTTGTILASSSTTGFQGGQSSNAQIIIYTTLTSTNIGNGKLYFSISSDFDGSIDDVSIKELTQPALTIAIGNQTKTVSSISCVPGTFTKVVFNFLATASEVGQPIKIYANQADVIYLDDVSLTQAWDLLISFWAMTTSTSGNKNVVSCWDNTYRGFQTRIYNNVAQVYIGDNNASYNVNGATNVSNGKYNLIQAIINKTSTLGLYINGANESTTSSIVNCGYTHYTTLEVGVITSSLYRFNGNIGEIQIVRFDNIDNSNVNASTLLQAYRQGLGTWVNGQVVAWYKWRGNSDSQMLQDMSVNGNNLTGVNLTTADQERGNYPSK